MVFVIAFIMPFRGSVLSSPLITIGLGAGTAGLGATGLCVCWAWDGCWDGVDVGAGAFLGWVRDSMYAMTSSLRTRPSRPVPRMLFRSMLYSADMRLKRCSFKLLSLILYHTCHDSASVKVVSWLIHVVRNLRPLWKWATFLGLPKTEIPYQVNLVKIHYTHARYD